MWSHPDTRERFLIQLAERVWARAIGTSQRTCGCYCTVPLDVLAYVLFDMPAKTRNGGAAEIDADELSDGNDEVSAFLRKYSSHMWMRVKSS